MDAQALLDEADASRALLYGSKGRAKLFEEEVRAPRSRFLMVRTLSGFPVGCAALTRVDYGAAEIKCIYSRADSAGIGYALLSRLELDASALGYRRLVLALRLADRRTTAFCLRNGFQPAVRYFNEEAAQRNWYEKPLTPKVRSKEGSQSRNLPENAPL
ncbi:GNAT family N-acetyltransferase [Caballeronia zhejiangensis]